MEERIAALEARIAALETRRPHNPAPDRERQTLLRIIGALARVCYGIEGPYAVGRLLVEDAKAKNLRFDVPMHTIGAKLNDALPLVQ
jgi:hypothetical protein